MNGLGNCVFFKLRHAAPTWPACCVAALAVLVCAPALAKPIRPCSQPANEGVEPDPVKLARVAGAIRLYLEEHGHMPTSLADTLSVFGKNQDVNDAIRRYFISEQDYPKALPEKVTSELIDKYAHFKYIGSPDVDVNDVPVWEKTVIAFMRPEANPDQESADPVTSVVYLNGATAAMRSSDAAREIAESIEVFRALKAGDPLAGDRQSLVDLRLIARALLSYASAHDGELPPTLGASFVYVSSASKRLATSAQRARVYLAGTRRQNTPIPEEPTAEWIDGHTNYSYLAPPGTQLKNIEDKQSVILVYCAPEASPTASNPSSTPVVTVAAVSRTEDKPFDDWLITRSQKILKYAAGKGPLPDDLADLRDVRLIMDAVRAYATDHDGALPPDLGGTLPYVAVALTVEADAPEAGRVYLSARDERNTLPSDRVTPEWVNLRASYQYLGSAKNTLPRAATLEQPLLILCGRPQDACTVMQRGGRTMQVVPVAGATGTPSLAPAEWADYQAQQSIQKLKEDGKVHHN
jgi:hypothetical protein